VAPFSKENDEMVTEATEATDDYLAGMAA